MIEQIVRNLCIAGAAFYGTAILVSTRPSVGAGAKPAHLTCESQARARRAFRRTGQGRLPI